MEFPKDKLYFSKDEKKILLKCLDTGEASLFTNEFVPMFEKEFAKFIGTRYAILMPNCTTSLELTLRSLNLPKNSEVIIPAYTYAATMMAVLNAGLLPKLVDIDKKTFNINPELIKKNINKRVSAILPVGLFGNPYNIKEILEIAESKNLPVVEDCAQCTGSSYQNRKLGSFGYGCHSFGDTKILRVGEGGCITTSDKKVNDIVRKLLHEGEVWKRTDISTTMPEKLTLNDMVNGIDYTLRGTNYRVLPLVAALALAKFKNLQKTIEKMDKNAQILAEYLSDLPNIQLQESYDNMKRVWTTFVFTAKKVDRDKILIEAGKKGIPIGIHFPIPLHKTKLWKANFRYEKHEIAEEFCKSQIALPVYPSLNEEKIHNIGKSMRKIIKNISSMERNKQDLSRYEIKDFYSGLYFTIR
jgi:perosamine synthetase